jgi:hypothetical protein
MCDDGDERAAAFFGRDHVEVAVDGEDLPFGPFGPFGQVTVGAVVLGVRLGG